MGDWTPIAVTVMAFCAIAGITFATGQVYSREAKLRRRLPAPQVAERGFDSRGSIAGLVSRNFGDKRLGIDDSSRSRLRLNLVRAGYFRNDAVSFYLFWRLVSGLLLPILAYLFLAMVFPHMRIASMLTVVGVAIVIGIMSPDAFISRRQRALSVEYRIIFPDFLDLLLVCVDAGLTLDAAINRIAGELAERRGSRIFGYNLAMMTAEMRAGRSLIEAMGTMADRLMIAEARSLVALMRQSTELGSDVGEALRVFGNEMRDKRLLRAEENANKLSVKMLLPLGLFIMPVVLMVIVLPVIIRLLDAFR